MITPRTLDELGPDDRVAVLARDGEFHFMVHRAEDSPADVRARARRDGSEVVATHMRDKREILDLVAERDRNPGGVEG
jgi:hypothetical protein